MQSRAILAVNSAVAEPPTNEFRELHFRTNSKLIRHDTLEGREVVVVPMVMAVEGVLNGLRYDEAELSKTPASWNHKPVVIYHPTHNGDAITACSKEVIETQKVGIILNAKWDAKGKRLVAEAWLEVDRIKEVDERVWNAIQDEKVLELSTGLFVDVEREEGEFKGKSYTGIAHNFRPDHLAILPDQIGACSVADGAGFIRNEAIAQKPNIPAKVLEAVRKAVLHAFQTLKLDSSEDVKALLTNELSHEELRQKLCEALRAKHKDKLNTRTGYLEVYIEAVYDDFLIYSLNWADPLLSIKYTANDTGVKLSGEPTEVVRVTEYRTASGSMVGNRSSSKTTKNEDVMDRKEVIDGLIKNGAYSEEDRAWLMGLEQKRFDKVVTNAQKPAASEKTEEKQTPPAAPAANAEKEEKKPVTVEEYIAAAPEGMRDMLSAGLKAHADEKTKLVSTIIENCGGEQKSPYQKAELEAMSLVQLNKLATATTKPVQPNYGGLASAAPSGAPVVNAADAKPLTTPAWDFSKK